MRLIDISATAACRVGIAPATIGGSGKYAGRARAVGWIGWKDAILDGEAITPQEKTGKPDFLAGVADHEQDSATTA